MLLVVDRHNGIPAYRQIMDQIKFQIASGLLKPGDSLPSTRSLAENLALNPMTVSKAYSLLEHEKVVEHRPGMPLVVNQQDRKSQRVALAEQLRQTLEPTVTRVAQLGVPLKDAVSVFREMLVEKQNARDE
jgi:GntR family transcriptional regulator